MLVFESRSREMGYSRPARSFQHFVAIQPILAVIFRVTDAVVIVFATLQRLIEGITRPARSL